MSDTTPALKLQMRERMRVGVFNAADQQIAALGPLPAECELVTQPTGQMDFVLVYVSSREEVARWAPVALRSLPSDGLLWFAYPKRSSGVATDLTRDSGWNVLRASGLEPIRQIAIDEVWSALRFRPSTAVRRRQRG